MFTKWWNSITSLIFIFKISKKSSEFIIISNKFDDGLVYVFKVENITINFLKKSFEITFFLSNF